MRVWLSGALWVINALLGGVYLSCSHRWLLRNPHRTRNRIVDGRRVPSFGRHWTTTHGRRRCGPLNRSLAFQSRRSRREMYRKCTCPPPPFRAAKNGSHTDNPRRRDLRLNRPRSNLMFSRTRAIHCHDRSTRQGETAVSNRFRQQHRGARRAARRHR